MDLSILFIYLLFIFKKHQQNFKCSVSIFFFFYFELKQYH